MNKFPIPRNTFYQESPLATPSSISEKKKKKKTLIRLSIVTTSSKETERATEIRKQNIHTSQTKAIFILKPDALMQA